MCSGNLESALNLYLDSGGGKPSPEIPNNERASTSREDTDPGVRAPIPQSQGVLVDGQFQWLDLPPRRGIPSVFDPFRSFDTRNDEAYSQKSAHLKTLEDLFRPPLDITFKGTFTQAREAGIAENRWIIVDIQNVTEFQCQCLNRDVWSNRVVRDLIDKHFILWQVYMESGEGRRFITFYKVTMYPYVAIIDPRTGESVRVWNTFTRSTFPSKLQDFITEQENNSLGTADAETKMEKEVANPPVDVPSTSKAGLKRKTVDETHESPGGSKQSMKTKTNHEKQDSPSGSKHPMKIKLASIVDANEEEQLKAALEASIVDVKSRFKNGVGATRLNGFTEGCFSKSESKNGTKKKFPPFESVIPRFLTSLPNGRIPALSSSDPDFDDSWRKFLGDSDDPVFNLIIRYPDASREELTIPSTSQVQAITRYVNAKGYSEDDFDLLTFYPKRFFSRIAKHLTLLDIGFTAQETVFVHPK